MKKLVIALLIIVLLICGFLIGKIIIISHTKNNTNNLVANQTYISDDSQIKEDEKAKYDINGEYEPNYDEIYPGYVGTAFRFIFNDGKVKYYTDGEFEGTYTIEGNIINIVFTVSYNPGTGEPEEPQYLKGGQLTIIDSNTLQNEEGLNFYKKD